MSCCWAGFLLQAKSAVAKKVVVPCLRTALEHESEEVRAVAIRCLGYVPKETISPELVQLLLRSRHKSMRVAGTGVLPQMPKDSVPKQLMDFVLHHSDPDIRTAGFRYLCRTHHADSPRELALFWFTHASPSPPPLVSRGLESTRRRQSTMQDRIHTDLVKMALKHRDEVMREAAIQYLGQLPREQIPLELVRYTVSHTSLAVRVAGAQCFSQISGEKSAPDLEQACAWAVSPNNRRKHARTV